MKSVFIALLCVLGLSCAAQAKSCYSLAEAEAEQGIRIHSELMVIGLNCQHMTPPGQKNFYAQYRQITEENRSLFADYETRLLNYFKQSGAANAEKALNDLRTDFANEISENAAQMRPDVFCSRYVERINRAEAMSRSQLMQWASTFYESHPVMHPICEQ